MGEAPGALVSARRDAHSLLRFERRMSAQETAACESSRRRGGIKEPQITHDGPQ